jgi:predicted PurR-regulated permease PerM
MKMNWLSGGLKRGTKAVELEAGTEELKQEPDTRDITDLDRTGFSQRVLTAVGIVTAVVVSVLLLWYVAEVFLLVFAGILIAVFLHGSSSWVSRHTRLSHGLSLTVVVLGLVALCGLSVWLLAPEVASQISRLSNELPGSLEGIRSRIAQYGWGRGVIEQVPDAGSVMSSLGGAIKQAAGILSTTVGALGSLVVVVFFGLYLAADPHLYVGGLIRLVPIDKRERAGQILGAIGRTLHWWLIGRAFDMTLVGVLTWLGLWLLGIPLALTLGILAALLTFIPNIGPILSALPAVLLAYSQSQTLALYVILLYLAIQTFESYLITPLVQQRVVSLPPALTFTAQIVMGLLLGIPGVILATPFAAAMLVLARMLYVEDVLGDRADAKGGNGSES